MRVTHLALTHFRSFSRLELSLPIGSTVIWGDNGAGKSNLIESLYLLATSRSPYTSAEREMIDWHCPHRPAFARVVGQVLREGRVTSLEVLTAETDASTTPADFEPSPDPGMYRPATVRRKVVINGTPRQTGELLGHLNAVHFSPEEVELVAGSAERRRRFLDIALSQLDRQYVRTLRQYQRVLVQRNALLRHLRENPTVSPSQLDHWDTEAVFLGAAIVAARIRAVARLNVHLALIDGIAPGAAPIRITYLSGVDLPKPTEGDAPFVRTIDAGDTLAEDVASRLRAAFARQRTRERAAAITLVGPHRDDLLVCAGVIDQRTYGSRGQQRTAALALKIAEAGLMREVTGEPPVLLLDDVMSELDPTRRAFVEGLCADADQAIVTGTEEAVFSPAFRERSQALHLEGAAFIPMGS